MSKRDGYNSSYYAENREEINLKRKERYQNDEEYRRRVLQHSETYREKKRAKPHTRMPRFAKPKEYEAGDGTTIHLYSIGAFARMIRRSAQSISHWEKQGILPITPFRDERGHRLYTRQMIGAVSEAIGTRRRLFPVDPDIRDRISAAWEEMGIPVGMDDDLDKVLAKTQVLTE